jgi:hypothetical protein
MAVTVLSINLSNLPIFAQVCISEGGNSSCGPAPTKVSMPTSSNYPTNSYGEDIVEDIYCVLVFPFSHKHVTTQKPIFNPQLTQLTSEQKLTFSIPTTGLAQQFYISLTSPSSKMIICHTSGGSGNSVLCAKFDYQVTKFFYDGFSDRSFTNDELFSP